MMAFVHAFFVHLPNWAGFLLLIAVWVIFRSVLLRWRRRTMERMRLGQSAPMSMPPPPPLPPVMHGQVRCPRCSAVAPGVAAFCPHCGFAFNQVAGPMMAGAMAPGQMVRRPGRGALLFV